MVKLAVGLSPLALQDAAKELRADKEVVVAAVGKNGLALEYAAEELKAELQYVPTPVGVFLLQHHRSGG